MLMSAHLERQSRGASEHLDDSTVLQSRLEKNGFLEGASRQEKGALWGRRWWQNLTVHLVRRENWFIPALTFVSFGLLISMGFFSFLFCCLALAPLLSSYSLASEDKTCLVCFGHNWFSHLIRKPSGKRDQETKTKHSEQLITLMAASCDSRTYKKRCICIKRNLWYTCWVHETAMWDTCDTKQKPLLIQAMYSLSLSEWTFYGC